MTQAGRSREAKQISPHFLDSAVQLCTEVFLTCSFIAAASEGIGGDVEFEFVLIVGEAEKAEKVATAFGAVIVRCGGCGFGRCRLEGDAAARGAANLTRQFNIYNRNTKYYLS